MELAEIGPRFVLQPIRVFSASFRGMTLYDNPHYLSPNHVRPLRLLSLSLHRYRYRSFVLIAMLHLADSS